MQAVVMVLVIVAVLAVQAGLMWGYMNAVARYQRAKDDLRTCEAIWSASPDI